MAKDNSTNPQGNGADNLSGLPQPFRFMAYLIDKYFIKMKPWVQILIILGFFLLLMLAGLKALWPDLLTPKKESPFVELRGSVTGPEGVDLPDSLWAIELFSEDLFVKKAVVADRFSYQWILKVPKEKMDAAQRFKFVKYDPEARKTQQLGSGAGYSRNDLYRYTQQSKDGEVHFQLDYITMELVMDSTVLRVLPSALRPAALFPILHQTSSSQSKRQYELKISSDSLDAVFKEYKTSANPVQQMMMREILVETGTSTMLALADSLKRAVARNQKGSISDFALALTEYDSLGQLTSSGRYSDRFDRRFYDKAIELLHTGNEFESRNLATFLRKIQDARSIDPLFREFSHSDNVRAQRLCIYVLETFSLNTGAQVRGKVKTWLEERLKEKLPADIRKAVNSALTRF